MQNRRAIRRSLTLRAVATIAVTLPASARGQALGPAPAVSHAMVKELAASRPHPSLGDQARVFDRFVGTWDCAYTYYLPDGTAKRSVGELRFGWVLDGRAMQDIWISYPQESGEERKIGTSIRMLDREAGLWHVVFVSPTYNAIVNVKGGVEGDRIVLRGWDSEGAMMRWSFTEIRSDSFVWRGETSRDGGGTWTLEEEHRMTRRAPM